MRLIFKAPFDVEHRMQVPAIPGRTLGLWFQPTVYEEITAVMINGVFVEDWRASIPEQTDSIHVFLKTGALFTSIAAASIWGILASSAIVSVISAAVSLGLGYIIRALTPTPHQTEGKVESIFGISGRTNTTAQGTPKPLVYGAQRVYGHILTTRTAIADGGRALAFGILYGMGEGPISALSDPHIDDVSVSQYHGVETYTRLGGADNATLIHPDFALLSQVWSDGRQLPLGQPVIYQTKSTRTFRVTLFFFVPVLRTAGGGTATQLFHVEYRAINEGTWHDADLAANWSDNTQSPRFFARAYTLPGETQWLLRITLSSTTNQEGVLPTLYNIMEEQNGNPLYPTLALLAFRGISSAQIQSFDAMRGSAYEAGRLVPMWNGATFTTQWSNSRAWAIYDLLTHPRLGLGHRLDPSLIDQASFLAAQQYWEIQAGANVGFPRNRCDVLINDRQAAQDWLKILLSEGRAILIPSNGQLKLVVDQPGEPGLLYSSPGNMIEGSVRSSQGTGTGVIPNTILLQFPDEANGYRPHLLQYREPGTESEPQREAPAVTLHSIVSFEHAWWMARYLLLRQRLVQRHVEWQSPLGALVSEPFDHVAVSYPTPNFARGAAGFLNEDSNTIRLVLDQLVTLAAATSYTVMVRHQASNLMETRLVATGEGLWGAVTLAAPLSQAPTTGDLWAIGVTNTSMPHLVIEQVEQDGEQGYRLTGSVYVPTLYDYPTPPANPLPPPPPLVPPSEGGPVGGAGLPTTPVLSGAFFEGGTFLLSWSAALAQAGDVLTGYEVYRSPVDESSFTLLITLPAGETTTGTIATDHWFTVRAVAAMGGPGAFSNHVHAV